MMSGYDRVRYLRSGNPMEAQDMLNMIAEGQMEALEAAWIQAVEQNLPLANLAAVLEALVAAEQLDTAEMFGWELLAERSEQLSGQELLEVARAAVSAVETSDQLRNQAAEIYRGLHDGNEHFDALLAASGLLTGQSPRRALRTMDTCLALKGGDYLANRFDGQVVRVEKFQDALGEFELTDSRGRSQRLEPKAMADEFDPVDAADFRVLYAFSPDRLAGLLDGDPAEVLIAICKSRGGRVDANGLKDMLVDEHLPKDKWSSWWNRARTAAKRSENLSLAGRPIVVEYHAGGRTLEEELTATAAQARTPLDHLAVLQQYVRETKARKLPILDEFTQPIVDRLAHQATTLAGRSDGEALTAALALTTAANLGVAPPTGEYPTAATLLAQAASPADVVAQLPDRALYPAALDALAARDDAVDHLAALITMAPAAVLDEVAGQLAKAGRADAVAAAVAAAMADPPAHVELCLWLWAQPAKAPADSPGTVELFRKLLGILSEMDKDLDIDRDRKRETRQRIRAALSASSYSSYRRMVGEIDEAIAATVKTLIERSTGLAVAVREQMMDVLRENFYSLFVTAKVEPWLDEAAIWSTEVGLHRREDELKHLIDIKMADNAKAIGAAAAHGDLSENSEWQFAIEERDLLRAQAARMQDELMRARAIHPEDVPTDSVGLGSRVHLLRPADNAQLTLDILGPWDSDINNHIYNYKTLLAQALLGKAPGEEVTLKLSGEEAIYRIESVSSALA